MDRFQYIAESGPNIAFSKTLKQEPFFSGLRTMVFLRQRGKGDATSHYAARWLRLAAAVGSVK